MKQRIRGVLGGVVWVLIWGWASGVLAAGVGDASQWLLKQQATDGSWGAQGLATTSTAEVVLALKSAGQGSAAVAKALSYLQAQKPSTTDELARRLRAYALTGTSPASGELAAFLARQHSSGGFLPEAGLQPGVWETALALLALRALRSKELQAFQSALTWLQAQQRSDGGWSFSPKAAESSVYLTAWVLQALAGAQGLFQVSTALNRGVTYLKSKQNADGSWGTSDPSAVTARALLGLSASGAPLAAELNKALAFLKKQQASDGSFDSQNPFATAVSIQALLLESSDLALSQADLSVSASQLSTGSDLKVQITLHNKGLLAATNATLRLYLGDPQTGNKLAEKSIASVAAGGSVNAELTWPKAAPAGGHILTVVVVPGTPEPNASNHQASLLVTLVPPVDLEILAPHLVLIPQFPLPSKNTLVSIQVNNRSTVAVQQVEVGFYDGDPKAGGKLIGPLQRLPSIPAQGSLAVQASIPGQAKGSYSVYVVVDPNDKLKEPNRANNVLQRSYTVASRIDLVTRNDLLRFSHQQVVAGDALFVGLAVFNAGDIDAQNVVVRFYDGNPSQGGKKIADRTLNIPAQKLAGTQSVSLDTRSFTQGARSIYAVVDPDQKIADVSRSNNTAGAVFEVVGLADLKLSSFTTSPTTATEGSQLIFRPTITNAGQAKSAASAVHVYIVDPSSQGAKPVATAALAELDPGDSRTLSVYWTQTTGVTGNKTLWVVLDPEAKVREQDESNNTSQHAITFNPNARPDLTLSAEDIGVSPATPQGGSTPTFTATIRNLYGRTANNVSVRWYLDFVGAAQKIGEQSLSQIGPHGQAQAQLSWKTPADRASVTLVVVIDEDKAISEVSESNNVASRSFALGLSSQTAPTGLQVSVQGGDTLQFRWQAGSGANAAGIKGYRVYCNDAPLNPPTRYAGAATLSASTTSGSLVASRASDRSFSTFWGPQDTANQWLQVQLPQPLAVTGLYSFFSSKSLRQTAVQYWNGSSWQSVYSREQNTQELLALFPYVTSDRFRLLFPQLQTRSHGNTRELVLMQAGLATSLQYNHPKMPRGRHSCYVVGVVAPALMTPPSNAVSVSVGDVTPPAAPTGLTATPNSSFQSTSLQWQASSGSDLAGYRVYSSAQVDVADYRREAVLYYHNDPDRYSFEAINGRHTSGYTPVFVDKPVTIALARSYAIEELFIRCIGPCQYKVETSVDGQTFTQRIDRSQSQVPDQSFSYAPALQAKYIRIHAVSEDFSLSEVFAYAGELAPITLHRILNLSWAPFAGSNYWSTNAYGDKRSLKQSTATPIKLVYTHALLGPLGRFFGLDLDAGDHLLYFSGRRGARRSAWFTTKNLELHFLPFQDQQLFRLRRALGQGLVSGTSYTYAQPLPKGTVRFAVTAVDKDGNESAPSGATVSITVTDNQPPAAPTGLKATSQDKAIALSWTLANAPDIHRIRLYRDNQLYGTFAPGLRSFTDTGLSNGQSYTYQVSAVDISGNESAKAGPVTATPTTLDLTIRAGQYAPEIYFSPKFPSVGDDAYLAAVVDNIGKQAAPAGVQVSFYAGAASPANLIGTATIPEAIPAGQKKIARIQWKIGALKAGDTTITAVIDPSNKLPETDEGNNQASITVAIHSTPHLDTSVVAVDSRKFPVIDVDLRVRDSQGQGIHGLNEQHFKLREDAANQSIKVTSLNQSGQVRARVDLVFLIDSSSSMFDEIKTVCLVASTMHQLLLALNIDAKLTIYTLSNSLQCGTALKSGIFKGQVITAGPEDWGPGSTWLVKNHPWRAGAIRALVPISDEGAYQGSSPTNADDSDAVTEAITASKAAPKIVHYFPFWGFELNPSIIIVKDMQRMARETGGEAFPFLDGLQVARSLVQAIERKVADYRITYTTTHPARDGTIRQIQVDSQFNTAKGSASGQYVAPRSNQADLQFLAGLSLAKEPAISGQGNTLQATLLNAGGVSANQVTAQVTAQVGSQPAVVLKSFSYPQLAPGQRVELQVPWLPSFGAVKIRFVADPNNGVQESDETNNTLARDFALATVKGIELEVRPRELSRQPEKGATGEDIQYAATIHNAGDKDASDVLVVFYHGDPQKAGKVIGQATLASVPKGSKATATVTHRTHSAGDFELYVVVDPYDAIAETTKANNRAHRSFSTPRRALLLTVKTDKASYPANAPVKIDVGLENRSDRDWQGRGEVWIVDAKEQKVEKVGDFQVPLSATSGGDAHRYRLLLSWNSPSSATSQVFLQAQLNLTTTLSQLGASGQALDRDSIRVVHLDDKGQSIGVLPARFFPASDFNATSKAAGRLLFFLKDSVPASSNQRFLVAFNTSTSSSVKLAPAPAFPDAGKRIGYVSDQRHLYTRALLPSGSWGAEVLVAKLYTPARIFSSLLLGDFTGDGRIDLFAPNPPDRKIHLYPGTSNGGFSSTSTTVAGLGNTHIYGAASGDFNGDGQLDAAVSQANGIYVFLGNGAGGFTRKVSSLSGKIPHGLAAVDWDGDGQLDLVYALPSTQEVLWAKGDGKGAFSPHTRLLQLPGTSLHGLAVADFDGDGKLDLLLHDLTSGEGLLYSRDGQGTWQRKASSPALKLGATAVQYAAADWNYDGHPDVLACSDQGQKVYLLRGDGKGGFSRSGALNTASHAFVGCAIARPSATHTATLGQAAAIPVRSWSFTWNTGATLSGEYRAQVQLFSGQSGAVAEAKQPFTIEADLKLETFLSTDRLAYTPNSLVSLRVRMFNPSSNADLGPLKGSVRIDDPQGKQLDVLPFTLALLQRNERRDVLLPWQTKSNPPGTYKATLTIEQGSQSLATQSVTFNILATNTAGTSLLGALQVKPGLARPGESLTFTADLTHVGNQELTDHPVVIRIFSNGDRKEQDSIALKVSLKPQASKTETPSFDTSGLKEGTYTALLTTKFGARELVLDEAQFELKADIVRPKLTVSLSQPKDNDALPHPVASVAGEVSDGDAEVTVNGVKASISGASAKTSSFSVAKLNLKACTSTLEATASRGQDQASARITVTLPHRAVVLKQASVFGKQSIRSIGGVVFGPGDKATITDPNEGNIVELSFDGSGAVSQTQVLHKGLSAPGALVRLAQGDLVYAEPGENKVSRVASSGAPKVLLDDSDGLSKPTALALDGKGGAFVASGGNGTIFLVDKDGKVSTYAQGLKQPQGLAFEPKSGILYVADLADGSVYSVAKAGEKPRYLAGSAPGEVADLAWLGSWLILSDAKTGELHHVSLTTGKLTPIAGGWKQLGALASTSGDGFVVVLEGVGLMKGSLEQLKCREDEPDGEISSESTPDAGKEPAPDAKSPEKGPDTPGSADKGNGSEGGTTPEPDGQGKEPGCGCQGSDGLPLEWLLALFALLLMARKRRRPQM